MNCEIKKRRGKKGFTLVELLIVVAIIAVLVAIAIPVYSTQLEDAREAADDANLQTVKTLAQADWMLEHSDSTSSESIYYTISTAADGTLSVTASTDNNAKLGGNWQSNKAEGWDNQQLYITSDGEMEFTGGSSSNAND